MCVWFQCISANHTNVIVAKPIDNRNYKRQNRSRKVYMKVDYKMFCGARCVLL